MCCHLFSTGGSSCLLWFWVWSLGTKGIHHYAKENSNEINFILNHIWIWRGWDHTGFRCYAADLYCYGSLTALPVEFSVNSLYLLKSITEITCFALSPQAKRLSALHEVTDVFMWTYEYSITYLALCWQCVHHHQGDAKEFLGPGRREVLTSVFSSKSLILSLAEVSLAFLILISYSFIHFQVNTFVCVANNHQLNNCTLIFLFLFCMALAHVLYSSSSNSFLSKDEPRSPNNVAPN